MAQNRLKIIWITIIIVLFLITFRSIVNGFIPFWYDPARDLLSGIENLKKVTLIGPPTGIPGIFYFPYWTWLLSLVLVFTHDPRWITLLTTTIPYFIIMPLLFYKFRKIFGLVISSTICILFFLSYKNLTMQLWNPNLGPLIFLATIYFIIVEKHMAAGIFTGIGMGLNMAFGIVITTATILFYLIRFFNKAWKECIKVMFGLGLTLIPYFIFETRHGFNQTKMYIASLSGHSGVTLTGLSQSEIINQILSVPQNLLHIPTPIIFLVSLLLIFTLRKFTPDTQEKKLIIFLTCCLISLSYIYFISKNPKWEYHFIGLEILFALAIGLIVKYSKIKYLLTGWTIILLLLYIYSTINPPVYKIEQNNLIEKEKVVTTIYEDAKNEPFSVQAYNPAIYTFDYDYLFSWLGSEKYKYTPIQQVDAQTTYLIIPTNKDSIIADFINYKTPNDKYTTSKTWYKPDGTLIVKRIKF